MKPNKVAALVWPANGWQSARCSLRQKKEPRRAVSSFGKIGHQTLNVPARERERSAVCLY